MSPIGMMAVRRMVMVRSSPATTTTMTSLSWHRGFHRLTGPVNSHRNDQRSNYHQHGTVVTRRQCFYYHSSSSSSSPAPAAPAASTFSKSNSNTMSTRVVDLRSDTVTRPTESMLQAAMTAPVGDDVMGEDPTVHELERHMAELFGKSSALFVPTGTMANLVALLAHCHDTRAAEIVVGRSSHICLWEGGNAANVGGIHTIQVQECPDTAQLSKDDIRNAIRNGYDDHWPETKLLCLENTHNMCGGVALSKSYFDDVGQFIHNDPQFSQLGGLKVHVDGARIMNATVALETTPADLTRHVDSISVCFSKGLGAPLGSVLIGDSDMIKLAKRARKRCGGGMRQAGVVAAMGLYAIRHNVERLADDHRRAQRLGQALVDNGFYVPRQGRIDTNIVYFGLPEDCTLSKDAFRSILTKQYGVKVTGGYSDGGRLFRAVTHMDVDDDGIDRAINAIISTANTKVM